MTSTLFLVFLATMATIVVTLIVHYFNRRAAFRVLAGLSAWLIYEGLLGYFGVVRNTAMRPPGVAFLFVPVLAFLIFFIARFYADALVALSFSTLDYFGHAVLPRRRRDVPASALDQRSRAENADLRGRQCGHLCRSVSTANRLAIYARASGHEVSARVEHPRPSRTGQRRDSRRADGPRSLQPAAHRGSQPNDGHLPIPVYSRIFRPLAVVLHVLAIRAIRSRLRTAIPSAVSTDPASPNPSKVSSF